jgi:hypothetical protein
MAEKGEQMEEKITRKEFFKQLSMMGAAILAAGSLFHNCESSGKKESAEVKSDTVQDPCGDLSGLTTEEKSVRDEFEYAAKSLNPQEVCDNCALWIEPEGDAKCGGCQIMKGPIHPKGYCTAWVEIS